MGVVTLWKFVGANGLEKAVVIKSSILEEDGDVDTTDLEQDKKHLQVRHLI